MSIESRLKKPLGDWPKTLDKQIQTVLATPSDNAVLTDLI